MTGFWCHTPTTDAIMAGSAYQAGVHENCIDTKLCHRQSRCCSDTSRT
jgi:hypothetical protein